MDSYNQECTAKCPYRCTNRHEIGGFEKVIELKDIGFVIYFQNTTTENVQKKRTVGGIIIKKYKKATGELETQLDVNKIHCAPCRQLIRQAKVLLDKAHGMNSREVLGICDHCRSKALSQSHEPCNDCEEMTNVFLLAYSKQEDDLKNYIKLWLNNLRSLLEKIEAKKMLKSGILCRAHSDIDLDQLKKRQRKSPRQFAATLMFQSDEKLFDTESSKKREQLEIEKTRLEQEQKTEKVRSSSLDKEYKKTDINIIDNFLPVEPEQKTSAVPGQTIQKSRPSSLDKQQKGDDKKQPAGGIKDIKAKDILPTAPEAKLQKTGSSSHDKEEKLKEDGKNKDKLLAEPEQKLQKTKPTNLDKEIKRKEDHKKQSAGGINDIKAKDIQVKEKVLPAAPGPKQQTTVPRSHDEELKQKGDDKKQSAGGIKDMKPKDIQVKEKVLPAAPGPKQQTTVPRSHDKELKQKGDDKKQSAGGIKDMKPKDIQVKEKVLPAEQGPKQQTTGPSSHDKELKQKGDDKKPSAGGIKDMKAKDIQVKEKVLPTTPGPKQQTTEPSSHDKELKQKRDDKKQPADGIKDIKAKDIQVKENFLPAASGPKQQTTEPSRHDKELKQKGDDKKQPADGIKDIKAKDIQAKEKFLPAASGPKQQSTGPSSHDMEEKPKGDDKKQLDRGKKNKDKKETELDSKALKGQQAKDKENELKKQKSVEDKKKKNLDDKQVGQIKEKAYESNEKITKEHQTYDTAADLELRRLIAERAKANNEEMMRKKQFELEQKQIRELAEKQMKEMERDRQLKEIPEPIVKVSGQSLITELQVETLEHKKPVDDIIIHENIAKYRPPNLPREHGSGYREITPVLFLKRTNLSPVISVKGDNNNIAKADPAPESERKGIMHYALSDRTFIEKGWTMLPTEKVVRKMNVYRMRPAHPEFDWFERNKNKSIMKYSTGEKLAEFDDNGLGRWYYKNGQLALHYYDAEEINAQQRFVIFSNGEPDKRGRSHPITILATFDYLGNGIVLDHSGKIRLKYNQTEGVLLDRSIGPVSHWKWHTLNDPPILQQVMMDTEMAFKDVAILKRKDPTDRHPVPENEQMIAIEFDNYIKEKNKKLDQNFKPFQIKMKALKINEHFSLRILDQATIYLIFRDGTTNIKLNLGMILDHKEIVDTDTAEVGEVSSTLERLPARTNSLAALQRSIAHVQHYERSLTERERRLRPTVPCASADKLIASTSRPLRSHVRTLPAHEGPATPSRSASNTPCCIYSKKPPRNLYYDSRLT